MAYIERVAEEAGGQGQVAAGSWAAYVSGPKARKLSLRPHEALFYEGDVAEQMYELSAGTMMLYKLLPDGRRQVVEILQAGDLLGIQCGKYYDCTAEALSDASIVALNRKDVESSLMLQQHLGRHLLAQMETLHEHAVLLGRKSALERVASYLMRFVPGRGQVDCPGPASEKDEGLVELHMTRQEIADYLGLTIETVSRALSELKRRGFIRLEKQDRIQIPRICGLCRLTGMH